MREITTQRQWTIEARADFAGADKNEAISEAIRQAAIRVAATISLLQDGVKAQVVAYSDDFFHGHEDIALFAEKVKIEDIKAGEDEGVSDELMAAARAQNEHQ